MDKRFTPEVVAAARASMDGSSPHIPASVSLAQWALESDFGEHRSGKNNCFGIKAVAGQACTTRLTRECLAGRWVTIPQHFADYPTLAAGMTAHAMLLAHGAPYEEARRELPDVDRFGAAMARRYATDPHYWAKLRQIIDSNGLRQFDRPAAAAAAPASPVPAYLCKVCGRSDTEAREKGCGDPDSRLVKAGSKAAEAGAQVGSRSACPMEAVITSAQLAAAPPPARDVDATLAQRAAERAYRAGSPQVGPTVAPPSADRSAGLLAHIVAWMRGRPA